MTHVAQLPATIYIYLFNGRELPTMNKIFHVINHTNTCCVSVCFTQFRSWLRKHFRSGPFIHGLLWARFHFNLPIRCHCCTAITWHCSMNLQWIQQIARFSSPTHAHYIMPITSISVELNLSLLEVQGNVVVCFIKSSFLPASYAETKLSVFAIIDINSSPVVLLVAFTSNIRYFQIEMKRVRTV